MESRNRWAAAVALAITLAAPTGVSAADAATMQQALHEAATS